MSHFLSTGTTNIVSLVVLLTTVLFLFILGWLEYRANLWVQRNRDDDEDEHHNVPTNTPPTAWTKLRLRPAQFALCYTSFDWILALTFYFGFVSHVWLIAFWVLVVAATVFELKYPRGRFVPRNRTYMVTSAFMTWYAVFLMVLAYECFVFTWAYNHSVNNTYSAYDQYLNPKSASYRRVYDPSFHRTFAICSTVVALLFGGLTYYLFKKEKAEGRGVDMTFFSNQERDDGEMVHVENDTEKAEPDGDFVVLK